MYKIIRNGRAIPSYGADTMSNIFISKSAGQATYCIVFDKKHLYVDLSALKKPSVRQTVEHYLPLGYTIFEDNYTLKDFEQIRDNEIG